jgi:hypothetical protein
MLEANGGFSHGFDNTLLFLHDAAAPTAPMVALRPFGRTAGVP